MKTALVAGGAGFIGSHLCEALLERDINVICVDNYSTSEKRNIEHLLTHEHFRMIVHDVSKPLEISPSETKIDFIFHFASPASPNIHSPISYHALAKETMDANTVGTDHLLQLAKKHEARFMFASTSEIYGDPLEHPQKESYNGNTSTTGPRSVYDESKRFGETLTAHYHRKENVDTRIVRIFNTYGPRLADDQRMIIQFGIQALTGQPITIYGDGTQTRSICYVTDLIDGILMFMLDDNLSGQIINLGTTEEYQVIEFARIINDLCGGKSEIILTDDLPEDEPRKRKPDITKAKTLLNWGPKIPMEEGLKKTIEYIKSHNL